MTMPRHIAVLDVGKTNAKLALVETETLTELAVVTRPNTVIDAAPYPHFDLAGHWEFFLDNLAAFHASHGIDAISVTTHGAACVLLDDTGALATPILDYEHKGPDELSADYDALRPPFEETGSPRLPMGLNLGAQLHWLFEQDPTLKERTAHIVTYPQYWGFRLTGAFASDLSSLGCHTDLWRPREGDFSSLVGALGIAGRFAEPRKSSDILGTVTKEVAQRTGLAPSTPVVCGIHDSNASLLPHLLARQGAFSVVSTGTWVIVMGIDASEGPLDPARDTLVNVSATGDAVPSARFMGGREYELIRNGSTTAPTEADRACVLAEQIMLLPSVVTESGPFAGRTHEWTREPATDGERIFALSLYLALMTNTCLDLIYARGPTVVEGPFARNRDFLDMLAALRPEGVEMAASATGTSIGAALLFANGLVHQDVARHVIEPSQALSDYATVWKTKMGA